MPRMTQQEAQALWEREQAKEAARIQAEEKVMAGLLPQDEVLRRNLQQSTTGL